MRVRLIPTEICNGKKKSLGRGRSMKIKEKVLIYSENKCNNSRDKQQLMVYNN